MLVTRLPHYPSTIGDFADAPTSLARQEFRLRAFSLNVSYSRQSQREKEFSRVLGWSTGEELGSSYLFLAGKSGNACQACRSGGVDRRYRLRQRQYSSRLARSRLYKFARP